MSKRYAKRGVTEQELRDMIDKEGLYEAVWSDRVQKDISKIQFDCENIGIEEDDFNMEGFEPGYETLASGVPVLWVGAGGDWEGPVAFCVYVGDDGELRAYVPSDGNVYNKEAKAAFGNDDDIDQYSDHEFDMAALRKDASERIVFKDADAAA